MASEAFLAVVMRGKWLKLFRRGREAIFYSPTGYVHLAIPEKNNQYLPTGTVETRGGNALVAECEKMTITPACIRGRGVLLS